MPTKNPRINVALEKPLYNNIERLAKRDGVSLSMKVRDRNLSMKMRHLRKEFSVAMDRYFLVPVY